MVADTQIHVLDDQSATMENVIIHPGSPQPSLWKAGAIPGRPGHNRPHNGCRRNPGHPPAGPYHLLPGRLRKLDGTGTIFEVTRFVDIIEEVYGVILIQDGVSR